MTTPRCVLGLLLLPGCTISSNPAHDTVDASPDAFVMSGDVCPSPLVRCGFSDGGWTVSCHDRDVIVIDMTETWYCQPGHPENVVCRTHPHPVVESHCDFGCEAPRVGETNEWYFETYEEYSQFDKSKLCTWEGDAGYSESDAGYAQPDGALAADGL